MSAKTNRKESTVIRVFIPNARQLTSAEIEAIPVKEKEPAGSEGIWIKVACPDDSCTVDGGRICLPAASAASKRDKGVWLKIFCPEDRCFFEGASNLP